MRIAPNRPQTLIRLDVSVGSDSEFEQAEPDFRFTPQSRHPAGGAEMSVQCQGKTHAPRQCASLFEDLSPRGERAVDHSRFHLDVPRVVGLAIENGKPT